MTSRRANIPASVRQRLLNLSRERGEAFEQVLVRFALERLLYRLGRSEHSQQFVLKGALLFQLWFDLPQRPTRDADFLGFGSAEPEHLAAVFRELAGMQGEEFSADGLKYLADTVGAEPIREAAGYPGVRVSLFAELAAARIPVQCDIGFGDAVTPPPELSTFPTLLELPAPQLRVYPPETVFAEKLEALVKLGSFNSRMKDYFDLWVLMRHGRLDPTVLREAVHATFVRRATPMPQGTPEGLQPDFAAMRQTMWQAFLDRSGLSAPPLDTVLKELRAQCGPLLQHNEHKRK